MGFFEKYFREKETWTVSEIKRKPPRGVQRAGFFGGDVFWSFTTLVFLKKKITPGGSGSILGPYS